MANGTLAASQLEMLSQGGTGITTIIPPATNTNRTLTLPDSTTTVVGTDTTQTLTNKTIQGGVLTLATAVTASGTAVDFTSIPSWVKRITVMFSAVSTSGSSFKQIQLIHSSNTVVTTGYRSSGARFSGSVVAQNAATTGIVLNANQASDDLYGLVTLTNVTADTWSAVGGVTYATGNLVTSGGIVLSNALTGIRITTVNGTDTFDAGTINIIYEG